MTLSKHLAALAAAAALALPAPSQAAPEVEIPDFDHLKSKATETVDVTIGGFLLSLARLVTREEAKHDPALRVLDDIKSVKVRSFKFDTDTAYSKQDLDSVRRQLQGPSWNAIAQVRKREPQEDVDVYICVEESGKTCGLVVIATEPREFTVVSIVGSIDVDKIANLEGQFGIPDTSPESN